jgi:4-amino-4-deoxy-L-arabinose transferase-like glycosyltransferase
MAASLHRRARVLPVCTGRAKRYAYNVRRTPRVVMMAALIAATLLIVIYAPKTQWPQLRIDEAHKITDTFFFDLLLRGDFHDPAWLSHIVDRTNPPVGKFYFGIATWLSGAPLAHSLSLREELPGGKLGQQLLGDENHYRPTLVAIRFASLFASALTVALLVFSTASAFGMIEAGIAALLYGLASLVATYSTAGVYDALLTLLIFSSLLLLQRFTTEDRRIGSVVVLSIVCAFAFQTRLNGIVALVLALAALCILAFLRRSRRRLLEAAAVSALTLVLAVTINPYYWTVPHPAAGLPSELSRHAPLPLRIFERVKIQYRDAQLLVAGERKSQASLNIPQKFRFASEMIAGDVVGLLTIVGLILAAIRRRLLPHDDSNEARKLTIVWCAAAAVAVIVALPFAWPRYLFAAMPPIALIAGAGWGSALRAILMTRPSSSS